MSALVVDTSSWISYFAGRSSSDLVEGALEEGRVRLPPVVAAELASGKMTIRNRALLEGMLLDLPLCPTDLAHWIRVGRLRAALRAKGVTVSTPDAHVAQCALDSGAELLTEDDVFTRIAKHHPLRLARTTD